MVNWVKRGSDAKKAVEKAEAQAELNRKSNVFRFGMKPGEDTQITFVDGGLDEDGVLDMPVIEEHFTDFTGQWKNFVCVSEDEPCPVCETQGIKGQKSYLVGLLTVIDHTEWKDREGKIHKDERKLFAMKSGTHKLLQKIATKRKGLAGVTFDVSRSKGDMVPRVGDLFDFVEKRTHKQLQEAYGDEAEPINIEEAIVYQNAQELRTLGFGNGSMPVGSGDSSSGNKKAYEDEL